MAQLLLQQGNVVKALEYFERAAELSRTEGEIVNALSYAEATRTQLEVSQAPCRALLQDFERGCKLTILLSAKTGATKVP